jgi:hypothetical protein
MKTAFIILLIFVGISIIVLAPRIIYDIKVKKAFENTYAIQNVSSGMCIRPYNAGYKSGNNIIAYPHRNWECLTWEMISLGENTFLLKNLVTQKSFQPKSEPKEGVELWQQTIGGSPLQHWEFLKQSDETYLIRLKDTELYMTATSDKKNSDIILMPIQNSDTQKWRLIRQNPIV